MPSHHSPQEAPDRHQPVPSSTTRQNEASVNQHPHQAKLLLTPQEAAEALAINRSTLYILLMRGEIPSITIGRARRIPVSALESWIAKQIVQ